jgi:glycosyltransferase involved in cell wall biosynthesis
MPPGIEPIPISGWWASMLGQASLSLIGSWVAQGSFFKSKWDTFQTSIQWRTYRWHRNRFQKRIEREFMGRWTEFDAVYVHSSWNLASKIAQYRPTIVRLPGPVSPEVFSVLRKVHVVCANGDAFVQARKFLGDHAIELPIGVDTSTFAPGISSIRQALGWQDRHWVIGYVGRLLHLKGVDLLAVAFRETSRVLPDARLLIVGRGEKESVLRSILKEELARGIVHIEPDVSHQRLAEWYRAMNLFVMPSRYENFSNAIVEGMACGVPFLASEVGGNKILAKAAGGYLFESESIHSLTLALRQLSESSRELKTQGLVGADYVKKIYTWKSSAECLERIITSRLNVKI